MFETGKLNEIIRDFDLLSATRASGLNGELTGLITRLKLLAFETDPTQPYQPTGRPLTDYLKTDRNPAYSVLGHYWLERGCAAFLYAQSGIGKSSLTMQASACWACGKECIDLSPPHPLRIVVFQNEDTENDLCFQSKIVNSLKLDHQLLAQNCWIETLRGVQGRRAIDAMSAVLEVRKPTDLIFINPYGPYMGGDIMKPADNANFLYGDLQPLLVHFNCGAVIPHHTSKTQFQRRDSWSPYDYMYSGAGPATITNFARAVITIEPIKDSKIFQFRAAKRFRESGWLFDVANFRHSDDPDCPIWLPASIVDAKEAKKLVRKELSELIELVPPLESIGKKDLWLLAKKAGFRHDEFDGLLERALSENTIDKERLYDHSIFNPKGPAFRHVSRTPQPEDQTAQALRAQREEVLRARDRERKRRERAEERAEQERTKGPELSGLEPPESEPA